MDSVLQRGWSFVCLRRLDLRNVAHVLTDETLMELPTPSLVAHPHHRHHMPASRL
jgi:hypothetical protein